MRVDTKMTPATSTATEKIGELLLTAGVIEERQLCDAIEIHRATGEHLARILVDLHFTTDVQIIQELAAEIGTGYLDMSITEASPNAIAAVPEDLARRYHIIPIEIEEDTLVVAMASPDNLIAIDDLRISTGFNIQPVIAKEADLMAAMSKYYVEEQMVDEVIDRVGGVSDDTQGIAVSTYEISDEDEAPVVKLVNMLLAESVRQRAGDVHLDPTDKDLRVRFRIDGVLHENMRVPKKIQSALLSRLKIMGGMDISERRIPQDGRFGATIDNKEVDFRCASIPTIYGEKIVIRLLKKESILLTLDDLGFLPRSLDRYKRSFTKPYGAILITGPTGSGKTTTLYATLNVLNSVEKNMITVEDPVEYRLKGVNQVQVNTKAGLTFAAALRSILRHDPDIVMIGEMRDQETAMIGIEAALTGHLVLSTLHTRSAPGALTRLTEMGIEPFLTSSAVDCVIAQRLARQLCKRCKEEYSAEVSVLEDLEFPLSEDETEVKLYRAKGCKSCSNTGYEGRIGLYEVLIVSEQIEHLVVERATEDVIMTVAKQEGLMSLRHDGFEKVRKGMTSIEEVLRVTI